MDLLGVVAVVSGLVGAVLGGMGWWRASQAAAAAAACLRVVQDDDSGAPAEATAARAATNATSPPDPRGARGLEEPQAVPVNDKTANLVVRAGSAVGQDLPTNQGSGSGLLGVFLVNEGPAVARDIQLFATFPNGAVRHSGIHRSLSAHKEVTLFAQVLPHDFGSGATMDVLYRVAFRDANGEQALERRARLDGGWKGPWKTFLDADSGVGVDRPNGDPIAVSSAETAPGVNQ